MVPVEVLLGATCALGQLEAHSGNFSDAEEILTRALTKAEEHFGPHHPKVGVILTCIALMFRHKAKLEHSSALLIQEGLYRRAIEMLKAPSLETEGEESMVQRNDIVALARGGYADILSVQESRKAEGNRMRKLIAAYLYVY
ncbi:Tetratricopeptide repeat (TPR)-like superfamily protein [Thalictrum thalictroides]|uniref:Tetratricopeptide repeat (TPR)-like superfamily protein n=1 Tax=Thalictrum thalictroides TaxID=46969 RepID=A0A7J6UVN3_THATH|nr:Tetratricopeptide repeat (TPR)-like superfamily protein [Thalictrum thalictroides]